MMPLTSPSDGKSETQARTGCTWSWRCSAAAQGRTAAPGISDRLDATHPWELIMTGLQREMMPPKGAEPGGSYTALP